MRKIAAVIAAVALVAGLAYLKFGRGGDDAGEPAAEASAGSGKPLAKSDRPELPPVSAPRMAELAIDVDPAGDLRLEGQVIDATGDPVGGARVVIDARPPRVTTAADDGSFAFDDLVGRRYAVSAHAGDLVGGPVIAELTRTSDPVVIRMQRGSALTVEVVDASGAPIEGATAALDGDRSRSATSGADGRLELAPLSPGWTAIAVSAAGFATRRVPLRVPGTGGVALHRRISLERGTTVRGVVRDASGKAVSGARVVARSSAEPFAPINALADGAVTDKAGKFVIAGVGFGAYQMVALHRDYAPSSSGQIAVSESFDAEIEIVVSEGGVIAGRVVTASGDAAPWASVSVTTDSGSRGMWGTAVQRTATSGESGEFEITGLPRAKLTVLARGSEAASEIVDVDLRGGAARGLELRLAIDGTISGIVVDGEGEPIAEAQVAATADFWGGQKADQLFVRGPTFATTAGDGSFVLRGVPDGKHLLRASRGARSSPLGQRTPASTGDTGVKLVLPAEGGVLGEVVDSRGEPVAVASVEIPGADSVPTARGKFRLESIPPGTYDLIVRGPTFPQKEVRGVEIEPGEVTDAGRIEVARGRAISGVVRGPDGSPAAGATVAVGLQLVGDGANMITALGDEVATALGLRKAIADDAGRYRIAGVGPTELAIAAEHGEHGRSTGALVPAGEADQTIDIALAGLGSIAGSVAINGEPAPDVSVVITAIGKAPVVIAAQTGLDGGFAVDRAAAGRYKVAAMLGGGNLNMVSAEITVVAGERAEVKLEVTSGNIAVSVTIAGLDGARVDAAQVFLFDNPDLTPTTGGEVNQLFLSTGDTGNAAMAFSSGGEPASFEKVKPGEKSVCVVPITGDMNDPGFARRLQENAMKLAVYCARATVKPSPDKQSISREVPAMEPLPE